MKLICSQQRYQCGIFRVTEDRAVAPDGGEIRRFIVRHKGSAVVMPVDGMGRILLVRQFRLPAERFLWELPAGRIDEGETPLQAARRELEEETGYRARNWKKLISFYASPGYVDEKMTIFVASVLSQGEAKPADDERIHYRWFNWSELETMIRSGKLPDAKTILGLLFLKRYHVLRPQKRR
jgi:ADP-ribose pyrophosphatase